MHPGISLRRNGAGLFMMIVGTVQPFFMSQGIIQVHRTAPYNHKAVLYPVFHEKIRHIIR
jgi:hypothetical protein